jgi:DNA-binding response OmpR family regulator
VAAGDYSHLDHHSDPASLALTGQRAVKGAALRRLLVVEDQALLAELIAEGLGQHLEVLCAATVAEGVELLMGAAVDVVLLDCIVPGETTWQIVLEADRQAVPVVLMTGDPEQMKNAASGTRPYILKPFTLSDLKRVLEQRRARGEARIHRLLSTLPHDCRNPTRPKRLKDPQAKAHGLRISTGEFRGR